jgi:hypothetical protein
MTVKEMKEVLKILTELYGDNTTIKEIIESYGK